jgi:hypothetical protein
MLCMDACIVACMNTTTTSTTRPAIADLRQPLASIVWTHPTIDLIDRERVTNAADIARFVRPLDIAGITYRFEIAGYARRQYFTLDATLAEVEALLGC